MGIVWRLRTEEGDDRWMQLEVEPEWRGRIHSFTAPGLGEAH